MRTVLPVSPLPWQKHKGTQIKPYPSSSHSMHCLQHEAIPQRNLHNLWDPIRKGTSTRLQWIFPNILIWQLYNKTYIRTLPFSSMFASSVTFTTTETRRIILSFTVTTVASAGGKRKLKSNTRTVSTVACATHRISHTRYLSRSLISTYIIFHISRTSTWGRSMSYLFSRVHAGSYFVTIPIF